jgi:hypothetical protein
MPKPKKSASQLQELIAERLCIGPLFVRVHPDPNYGWHARVVTAPGEEVCSQQSLDDAIAELRARFDLKK